MEEESGFVNFKFFHSQSFALLLAALFSLSSLLLSGLGSAIPLLIAILILLGSHLRELERGRRAKRELARLVAGFHIRGKSQLRIDELARIARREFERRSKALSSTLLERKISSRHELSRALESISSLATEVLEARACEVSLIDQETGNYHSSFVNGNPAAISSGDEEHSLKEPIIFAGQVMGAIHVAFDPTRGIRPADEELIRLLALQAGIAIGNTEFTGQILRMKEASEESLKAKTGFLANLSHELRGPLGLMLSAVDIVVDGLCGDITDEQKETLGMVRENGQHFLNLVNDVLDYAKVESGKIEPKQIDLSVGDLLTDIAAVVRKQAEAKGHKIVIQEHDELLAISVDKRHIRQILINLLTNAIKYTPDNGEIHLRSSRTPGNKVRIEVRDSGIGISESDREKVFSAFERIENSYSLTQVGTGLGMALTRRLVEANGGIIDFSSEPGTGSTFWVIFDAASPEEIRYHQASPPEKSVEGKGDLILLAQRANGERAMMNRFLVHKGFFVTQATDAQQALALLEKQDPRLIVLDNDLVDSPGSTLVRDIRNLAKNQDIPLLLLSSRGFEFDIEQYVREGVDRCLIKPIDLQDFALCCRQLIDKKLLGIDSLAEEQGQEEPVRRTRTGRILDSDDVVH